MITHTKKATPLIALALVFLLIGCAFTVFVDENNAEPTGTESGTADSTERIQYLLNDFGYDEVLDMQAPLKHVDVPTGDDVVTVGTTPKAAGEITGTETKLVLNDGARLTFTDGQSLTVSALYLSATAGTSPAKSGSVTFDVTGAGATLTVTDAVYLDGVLVLSGKAVFTATSDVTVDLTSNLHITTTTVSKAVAGQPLTVKLDESTSITGTVSSDGKTVDFEYLGNTITGNIDGSTLTVTIGGEEYTYNLDGSNDVTSGTNLSSKITVAGSGYLTVATETVLKATTIEDETLVEEYLVETNKFQSAGTDPVLTYNVDIHNFAAYNTIHQEIAKKLGKETFSMSEFLSAMIYVSSSTDSKYADYSDLTKYPYSMSLGVPSMIQSQTYYDDSGAIDGSTGTGSFTGLTFSATIGNSTNPVVGNASITKLVLSDPMGGAIWGDSDHVATDITTKNTTLVLSKKDSNCQIVLNAPANDAIASKFVWEEDTVADTLTLNGGDAAMAAVINTDFTDFETVSISMGVLSFDLVSEDSSADPSDVTEIKFSLQSGKTATIGVTGGAEGKAVISLPVSGFELSSVSSDVSESGEASTTTLKLLNGIGEVSVEAPSDFSEYTSIKAKASSLEATYSVVTGDDIIALGFSLQSGKTADFALSDDGAVFTVPVGTFKGNYHVSQVSDGAFGLGEGATLTTDASISGSSAEVYLSLGSDLQTVTKATLGIPSADVTFSVNAVSATGKDTVTVSSNAISPKDIDVSVEYGSDAVFKVGTFDAAKLTVTADGEFDIPGLGADVSLKGDAALDIGGLSATVILYSDLSALKSAEVSFGSATVTASATAIIDSIPGLADGATVKIADGKAVVGKSAFHITGDAYSTFTVPVTSVSATLSVDGKTDGVDAFKDGAIVGAVAKISAQDIDVSGAFSVPSLHGLYDAVRDGGITSLFGNDGTSVVPELGLKVQSSEPVTVTVSASVAGNDASGKARTVGLDAALKVSDYMFGALTRPADASSVMPSFTGAKYAKGDLFATFSGSISASATLTDPAYGDTYNAKFVANGLYLEVSGDASALTETVNVITAVSGSYDYKNAAKEFAKTVPERLNVYATADKVEASFSKNAAVAEISVAGISLDHPANGNTTLNTGAITASVDDATSLSASLSITSLSFSGDLDIYNIYRDVAILLTGDENPTFRDFLNGLDNYRDVKLTDVLAIVGNDRGSFTATAKGVGLTADNKGKRAEHVSFSTDSSVALTYEGGIAKLNADNASVSVWYDNTENGRTEGVHLIGADAYITAAKDGLTFGSSSTDVAGIWNSAASDAAGYVVVASAVKEFSVTGTATDEFKMNDLADKIAKAAGTYYLVQGFHPEFTFGTAGPSVVNFSGAGVYDGKDYKYTKWTDKDQDLGYIYLTSSGIGLDADAPAASVFSASIVVRALDLSDHTLGEPKYNWADNHSTCEATIKCTVCGDVVVSENGTVSSKTTKDFTCTEDGEITYTATFENDLFSTQTVTETVPAHHVLVHVEAKAATCTEDGNIEYWQCSVCHKYFSDEDAKTEITQEQTVIGKLGHKYDYTKTVYTVNGDMTKVTASVECTRGDYTLTETAAITSEVVEPTCTEYGKIVYTAAFTNENFSWSNTVTTDKPLGHNFDYEHATYEVTTENGVPTKVVATAKCTRDATHTDSDTSTEITSVTTATCTSAGKITYTAVFTNKNFSWSETVDQAALGHEYTVNYVWSSDKTSVTATAVCSRGDSTISEDGTVTFVTDTAATCETVGSGHYHATFANALFTAQDSDPVAIPALGHKLTVHVEAKAATCTEPGNREYWQCSVCHKYFLDAEGTHETTYTGTLTPALGHEFDFENATYVWSDDYSTVIATAKCVRCDVTVTETVDTISYTKEATCTVAGSTEYIATFTTAGFKVQTKSVEIPTIPHVPGEPVRENYVAPTTSSEGSYDMVVYCQVGGEELSRTHYTIDRLPTAVIYREGNTFVVHLAEGEYLSAASIRTMSDIASRYSDSTLTIYFGDYTLKFDNTALKHLIAEDTLLSIVRIDLPAEYASLIDADYVYEVTFGSNHSFAGGKISISVPYGGNTSNMKVFSLNNGRLEQLDSDYEGGFTSFETSHLSIFAITGDDTSTTVLVIAALVGFIVVIIVVLAAFAVRRYEDDA